MTLDKDAICVWNNNVYILRKSSFFAVGRLKYFVKFEEIKFKSRDCLYDFICKETSSTLLFMDNRIPSIGLNNDSVGDMKKLNSYRNGIKCLREIDVIYLNLYLSDKVKKKLKYIVDDICYIAAFKLLKPFKFNIEGILRDPK